MMGTEIFKIDASWAKKLTKMRVSVLMNPSVWDVCLSKDKETTKYIENWHSKDFQRIFKGEISYGYGPCKML